MDIHVPRAASGIKLSVIGTGYLGIVHAACMTMMGHEVTGVDRDAEKVRALARGVTPLFEPGLEELLAAALDSGRLTFSHEVQDVADAAAHFICVGTPQVTGEDRADLGQLIDATKAVGAASTRDTLVIGKSTVPVGTSTRLLEVIRSAGAPFPIRLAWNPEFLREGHAIEDTIKPSRLVFGLGEETAAEDHELLAHIYRPVIDQGVPCVVTDLATAELAKVAANAFLATKISYVNALAGLCEVTGAEVSDLSRIMGLDPRIGPDFLGAGLGYGGGCLPKDVRAFGARASELSKAHLTRWMRLVDEINLERRQRVIDLVRELQPNADGTARVAVLGAAFKPNSDDIRDSPGLEIADVLHRAGYAVTIADPRALHGAGRTHPHLTMEEDHMEACVDADLVILCTEWAEYRSIDPHQLAKQARSLIIIDARNALEREDWVEAGWEFLALGKRGGAQ